MSSLLDRIGVELPIVHAGVGEEHRLTRWPPPFPKLVGSARSDSSARLACTMRSKQLTTRPIAVNLLLPFARHRHWQGASTADVVVTFWGWPFRRTPRVWMHQCGTVGEALATHAAGVDVVIAQGIEAGGQIRGKLACVGAGGARASGSTPANPSRGSPTCVRPQS